MALVGYARVSSVGQSLELQLDQLAAAGCEKVFYEKQSGRSVKGRPQLAEALEWVREGDTLIVTRLDRLARSVADLRQIIDRLDAKGARFSCLQQTAVETASPSGRVVLNILATFAEFENDIRRERQAEGIARAKAAGKFNGRPPSVDYVRLAKQIEGGAKTAELVAMTGLHRTTIQRAAAKLRQMNAADQPNTKRKAP